MRTIEVHPLPMVAGDFELNLPKEFNFLSVERDQVGNPELHVEVPVGALPCKMQFVAREVGKPYEDERAAYYIGTALIEASLGMYFPPSKLHYFEYLDLNNEAEEEAAVNELCHGVN
jgi:hypothetical protein